MISQSTIEKVYEATRVEEVIGDFVQLKRSGSNYKGLSPFSNERTPSFMVSPVKQIWKDFSSGKGGNAIAFLMEHEHFTYVEAIRYLAKKYNIEVEETQMNDQQKAKSDEKESMYLVSEFAQKYFQDVLWETEQGKAIALTYFKERGFTDQTIKKFQLGYSLDQWTAFTDKAIEQGYQLSFLEKTGLTIVKEDKKIDRFKGRVMFPIHSMSGRVLGFGGRILSNDKKLAKYLNSPESEIYHKSNILYGIFHAKQHIAKADNCYLVEGYTDVIQLHQRGIQNVVASSGTALTSEQIRLIHRLTPNITMLYDGDPAGLRASVRGIDLILEQGMNVKICTFPHGEDPDSFARKMSYEDMVLYLEQNTQDFMKFKASLLMDEAQHDPLKRAEIIRDMVVSISKIPDIIKQEIYIRECAEIMNVSEETLFSTLSQITKKNIKEAEKELKKQKKQNPLTIIQDLHTTNRVNPLEFLEKDLIKHLILYGQRECTFEDVRIFYDENGNEQKENVEQSLRVFEKFFLELQSDELEISTPFFKQIFDFLLNKYQQNPLFDIAQYINEIPNEFAQEIASILVEDEKLQLHKWFEKKEIVTKDKDQDVAIAVNAIILNIRRFFIFEKIQQLQKEFLQDRENPLEENSRKEILKIIANYLTLQKLINLKLNRIVN